MTAEITTGAEITAKGMGFYFQVVTASTADPRKKAKAVKAKSLTMVHNPHDLYHVSLLF